MRAFLKKANLYLFYLSLLFLPTQFGKHFFPDFATVLGIRIDYLAPTIYLSDILVALFLVTSLLVYHQRILKSLSKPNKFIKKYKLQILFLLILGISISVAQNKSEAWYGLAKLLEFSLFAICTSFVIKKKTVKPLTVIFMTTTVFESILAIAQFIHQGALGGIFYFLGERYIVGATPGAANASLNGALVLRPYGTFSHPNVLAAYLVIGMTLIVCSQALKSKILTTVLLLLGTAVLLLSLSRTVIIVWLGFLVYYFAIRRFKQLSKLSLSIVLGSIIVGFLIFFLTPLHFRFIGQLLSDESVTERQQLLFASFNMIKDHPLFGVGLNNFLPALSSYFSAPSVLIQPVHNIFVLSIAEIGFFGFLFILYFCFKTFKTLQQKLRDAKKTFLFGIAICLIEVCFLGQADHYFLTLQQGQLLLAFLLGCAYTKNNA